MYKKFFILLILILLFVVFSFANVHFGIISAVKKKVKELKEKKDSTLVVRPAPETVILSETTLENFSRQEGSALYFSLDATEVENLQQGKIIIGTKGEGFLRKVVSVTKTATEYIVETAPATLEEAFEDLQLSFKKALNASDINPTKAPLLREGVILKPSKVKSNALTVSISKEIEIEDGLTLEGSIEFELEIDFRIEIKRFRLKNIRFVPTLTQTGEIKLTSELKTSFEKDFTLATIYFAPIVVGPVTFVPEIKIVFGGEANAGIKVETGITQVASLSCGLEYDSGNWSPIVDYSFDLNFNRPTLTIEGDAKVYIGPQLGLKIYGVVGPYFDPQGYLSIEAQLFPENYWRLYGGVEVPVGIEFTILSFIEIGYERKLIDWKKLLFEATVDYGTPPKLLWAGEPNFVNTGVYPEVGVTTNTFVYKVIYKDEEDNPPAQGYPKVHILKQGKEIDGSPFSMERVYSINYRYDEGVVYEYARKLSSGTYSYYFEAKDELGNVSVAEGPVNRKDGPIVTQAPNKPPKLYWTGETHYTNKGVYPDEGKPNKTPFIFRVLYKDEDGNNPGYVRVHILKNGVGISNSPFSMIYIAGDNNTGATYSIPVTLPSGSDYQYYFSATDIYDEPATGEATQTKSGPNVDPSYNHNPELSWKGGTGYESDGLEPEKGKPNLTPFYYKIIYKDIDNDAPLGGYPKLHIKKGGVEISSSPFVMSSGNIDYYTGVEYYTVVYLSSCTDYTYYFEAYDVDGATATGVNNIEKTGPIVDSKPPELLWVGDTNYESDGLNPEDGRPKTDFVYRIKYRDQDDDPPKSGYPKVHIKKDGVEISGSPFTMTRESYDTNYSTGVVYKYTIKLSSGDKYSYYFETYDPSDFKAETEEKNGPVVTNKAPVLDWEGIGEYAKDGLDPEEGRPDTKFVYRVKYQDKDDDPPLNGYPKLHILKDGAEIQDSPFWMTHQEGLDYKAGVIFSHDITIPSSGTYSYYFEAKDDCDTYASGEPTNEKQGPVVDNIAPVLEWVGVTNYINDGIHPDIGRPSTYTYRVKYKDQDGDEPLSGYPKVHILKGGSEISGSPFTMAAEIGGDYISSKNYKFEIILSSGDNYSYYFEAKDFYNTIASGAPTLSSTGPVVINNAPELLWTGETNYVNDGLHPETGTSSTTFVFRIKYKDQDDDPPKQGCPKVHIDKNGVEIPNSPFSMTFVSSDTTGAIYTTSMTLLCGDYSYYFEARDIYDAVVYTITKDGPTLGNTPPVLYWSIEDNRGVEPSTGTMLEAFSYQIIYQDSDNDPPAAGYPKVHILKNGVEVKVASMTPNGDNYIYGVRYNYHTYLSSGTNYSYYFEAYDIRNSSASGEPTNLRSGPTVYYEPYWVLQTVETQGDVGRYSSIKVDSNKYPHIAYVDTIGYNDYKVKYAKWTGTSWSTYTITDGNATSLAYYNSNNNIYISYFYLNTLKCATYNGSSWSSGDVFYEQYGQCNCTSIAVGSDGVPQIAFAWCSFGANMGEYLRYAKKSGSFWSVSPPIDSGIQYNANSVSIALDSSNYPHIVYFQGNDLKYAKFNGVSWSTSTVDTQIGSFGYCFASIAIKNNIPHIAYYDSQNKYVKYAKWNGTEWQKSNVDSQLSNNYVGVHPTITIDNNDNPYIVYCLNTNYSLRYARWTGSQWEIDNVPINDSILVSYPSVVIDSSGKAHISYYDSTNGNLGYARWEP